MQMRDYKYSALDYKRHRLPGPRIQLVTPPERPRDADGPYSPAEVLWMRLCAICAVPVIVVVMVVQVAACAVAWATALETPS